MSEKSLAVSKRWRCEIRSCSDKNLIAKFFRAETAQDAMDLARKSYGQTVTITVTLDE